MSNQDLIQEARKEASAIFKKAGGLLGNIDSIINKMNSYNPRLATQKERDELNFDKLEKMQSEIEYYCREYEHIISTRGGGSTLLEVDSQYNALIGANVRLQAEINNFRAKLKKQGVNPDKSSDESEEPVDARMAGIELSFEKMHRWYRYKTSDTTTQPKQPEQQPQPMKFSKPPEPEEDLIKWKEGYVDFVPHLNNSEKGERFANDFKVEAEKNGLKCQVGINKSQGGVIIRIDKNDSGIFSGIIAKFKGLFSSLGLFGYDKDLTVAHNAVKTALPDKTIEVTNEVGPVVESDIGKISGIAERRDKKPDFF